MAVSRRARALSILWACAGGLVVGACGTERAPSPSPDAGAPSDGPPPPGDAAVDAPGDAPGDAVVDAPGDAAPPDACPPDTWGTWCELPCGCDDGLFCNGVERCDRVAGCLPGAPPVVDDLVACTEDRCDEAAGAVANVPVDAACDDHLFCDGAERCDPLRGCVAGTPPAPVDDGDPCTLDGACDEALPGFPVTRDDASPVCAPRLDVPGQDPRDFGFWYWPGNHRPVETWPAVSRVMHWLTGYYGLSFDEETGDLVTLGPIATPRSAEAALVAPAADVEALPGAHVRFEAGAGGALVRADQFLGNNANAIGRARLVDGGRFMNWVEIPTVRASADAAYAGKVEIASMPRHVVFTHTASSSAWTAGQPATATIALSGPFLAGLTQATWLAPGRALRLVDAAGVGWVFVAYDLAGATTTLSYDGAAVTVARTRAVAAGQALPVSLLALPTGAVTADELAMYLDPAARVHVGYTLLGRTGAALADYPVAWDERLGAFAVPLQTLQAAGAPSGADYDLRPETHTWYGRHRLVVDTLGVAGLAVPLAMVGTPRLTWYITGGAFLLRDAAGEPVGVPLQVSKNWHLAAAQNWYHLYAQPTFGPAPSTLELTAVSSRWGEAYAASHAQLSLVGWSDQATGRWEESALGAFGESLTYDPDQTANRSMVDDVRPFLVDAGTRWGWTGNVGGADFLRYTTAAQPTVLRRLARVRTYHAMGGPNLTDAVYAGVSTDGRIEGRIRARLGRTDDLVRVYYQLEYRFLQDVEYGRLAFFQMAADGYGDNSFTRYAYGNEAGTLFDAAVPDHRTTGYARPEDRGIPLPGDSPWVTLYGATPVAGDTLSEHLAQVGYVVRDFEANLGGTVLRTPYVNVNRTYNRFSQMAFELGLPDQPGSPWCGAPCGGRTRFVPAGSTVRATIEYLVPPAVQAAYYGAAPFLTGSPAAWFGTPDLVRELAAENHLVVEVRTGVLRRTQPVEVDAAPAAVAAELTLSGGSGYVAVTFHRLVRHDGWRLQRRVGGAWTPVDQAVEGNDYWQATYDADDGSWSLTYNVPNPQPADYRLVWTPLADRP